MTHLEQVKAMFTQAGCEFEEYQQEGETVIVPKQLKGYAKPRMFFWGDGSFAAITPGGIAVE